MYNVGGSIAQWFAYLLPNPAVPVLIPSVPDFLSEEIKIDVVEVNQWRCFEKSGQCPLYFEV